MVIYLAFYFSTNILAFNQHLGPNLLLLYLGDLLDNCDLVLVLLQPRELVQVLLHCPGHEKVFISAFYVLLT